MTIVTIRNNLLQEGCKNAEESVYVSQPVFLLGLLGTTCRACRQGHCFPERRDTGGKRES